jgi:surfactin synthase thioesterase subunit
LDIAIPPEVIELTAWSNIAGCPWILSRGPIVESKLKLFCFPFAGGGASSLRSWAQLVAAEIQVCLVQYPGKEARIRETPFRQVSMLADSAREGLLPYLRPPFAFFGYSMGAIVAFEVARRLRRAGHPGPELLIVGASPAPHCKRRETIKFNLPESEFIKELKELAGTPDEVLENVELIRLFLPAIRADFEAIETYQYDGQHEPLDCPIVAIGGSHDPDIDAAMVGEWRAHTRGEFTRHMVPGSHFFLIEAAPVVAGFAMRHLAPLVQDSFLSGRSSQNGLRRVATIS